MSMPLVALIIFVVINGIFLLALISYFRGRRQQRLRQAGAEAEVSAPLPAPKEEMPIEAQRRRWFFISGFMLGLLMAGQMALIVVLAQPKPDHVYPLIAMSRGSRMDGQNPLYYQAVVSTKRGDDGLYRVYARVNIGSARYSHSFQPDQDLHDEIGTAATLEEAVRNYGEIQWLPDRVIISGAEGEKASLDRVKLEQHR